MSAVSAIEVAEFVEVAARPKARLQLVTGSAGPDGEPLASRSAGVSRPAAQAPLRLTRRGQVVVAALLIVLATLAITVASMAFSGASAANHGRPGGAYAGMRQIVVRPGQTLWSIAARTDPSADPRQVVEQIMTANSMASSAVQAGQLLWVPN